MIPFICLIFVPQGILASVDQLPDKTHSEAFNNLVGLTWEQIQAKFPVRLQQLADETYDAVQRSKADYDVMEAFGVTDKSQTVASMTAEQRLQCLHIIMNDRCGCTMLSIDIDSIALHRFLFIPCDFDGFHIISCFSLRHLTT